VTFEFDPAKSASNKIKHGLDFVEVQRLWNSDRVEIAVRTVSGEPRFAVIGIIGGRHFTVIITYRGSVVRLISARSSRTNERKLYENC
jgi:uncharacterized DUF497 family protein